MVKPHHWINADGTCHAGDLFEHGTPSMGVFLAEQVSVNACEAARKIERLRKGNPINGDGSNATLNRALAVLGDAFPECVYAILDERRVIAKEAEVMQRRLDEMNQSTS